MHYFYEKLIKPEINIESNKPDLTNLKLDQNFLNPEKKK